MAQQKTRDKSSKPNAKVFPHNTVYSPFVSNLCILVFLFLLLASYATSQLNTYQAILHTHTHLSTFSSLTCWPVTSENNFLYLHTSFLLPFNELGCQKANLITGDKRSSNTNVSFFQGKEKSYTLQPVTKNPESF